MNLTRRAGSEGAGFLVPALPGGFPANEFAYEAETGNLLDLTKIWSALWRNRWLIIAVMVLSSAAGLLAVYLSDPTYRATASIEIEDQPAKILGTEDVEPVSGSDPDRLLQTQIDILQSRSLAERVSDSLSLDQDDRFLKSVGVQPKPQIRHQQVIDALRKSLSVALPRNSRVVPINFESRDASLAANVANSYAENLIGANLQRHYDTSAYSKEFLQNQLTLTKAKLEKSEQALLDYARSKGIVDPSAGVLTPDGAAVGGGGPDALTSSNLIDLNRSLASAKAARIQAEGRWREAAGTPAMNLAEVLGNPAIQQLTQRRADLQAEYEQELEHRKPDHPAVKEAAAAIAELNSQIARLAQSIKNSIHNDYETAQQQEAELSGSVGQLKAATLVQQQLGIRYNILKREVDTNRQLYDGLLQRFKQVSAEAGVTSNNISVVDHASAPLLPVAPNPFVDMALALFGGLVVALMAVSGLEMFHDGVRVPDDVEPRFGLALLGVIPRIRRSDATQSQLALPGSEISEAYQSVRTSLELSAEGGAPRTLLITSARESEGKTTTALAIARTIAQSGRTVLLIDADMRRPSLHRAAHIPKVPGLGNLLTRDMPTAAAIYATDTERLFVMPAGPKPPSPAELLSGSRFPALLEKFKTEFDQVIIDSPPVLGLADAPRIAAIAEGTLMVIEANRSHRGAIDAAMRRLTAVRARLIGAVLVKFDPRKADPGSDYLVSYYSYGTAEQPEEEPPIEHENAREEVEAVS